MSLFLLQSWLNCKHMIITELVWVWTLDCFYGNRTGSKGILLSDGYTVYNVFSCGCSNKQAHSLWAFFLAHLEIARCSFSLVVAMGMSHTNLLNGYSQFSLIPSVKMSMTISWPLGGLRVFAEFLYKRSPSLPLSLSSVIKWEVNKKRGRAERVLSVPPDMRESS